LFIFVVVPLVALGAYVWAGRPDLPDLPLASRATDAASPDATEAMIAKIEGHLAASPDDAKGWSVLAPVYMHMERYDDAAAAFGQLLRLKGENGELRADYGEALVAAAGGIVTADARGAFEKALADTPGLPKPRFYLALAAEQEGETQKAIELYQSLINDAKGEAPWKPVVAAKLAALKGEPAPNAPPAQANAGLERMSAEQQQMVRGMVERLATRLTQSGGSAEEWARLIRAYSVLHETDKAGATLVAARKALASDTAAVASLDTLARDLGLAEKTP
jgi:cytochrome c-type biogenesis protein CcmH